MSISSPASSRWSAPAFVASPTSRSVVSVSAAVGSGGFGSVTSTVSSSDSTPLSSSPSALTRRETSCISAIASLASSPAFLARAIPCEASFWRARRDSTWGRSSSCRASSASASSSRCSEPSRRRASADRTGSGSRRIAFRSSTARVCRLVGAGRLGRAGAGVLRDERRDLLRVLAGDDVLRHRARGEAAVLDRVHHVLLGLLALVEVRPVLVLAGRDLRRGALGAGVGVAVAARAVLHEQLRALVARIALGERDRRGAAGREDQGGRAQRQRGELSGSGE